MEHLSLQWIFFLRQVFEQTQSLAVDIQNAQRQMWMLGPHVTVQHLKPDKPNYVVFLLWQWSLKLTDYRVSGHHCTFIIFLYFCTHPQVMTQFYFLPKYEIFWTAALFGLLFFSE